MKKWMITLAVFVFARQLYADVVVLENYSSPSTGSSMALSTDTPAKINFLVAGFSGYLSRVKLRIQNTGTSTLNVMTLSFGLDSSASTITRDWIGRSGDISQNQYSNWEYDLGSLLTVTKDSPGTLYFKLVGQSSNAIGNWVTTPDSINGYLGWSGGSTENPSSGQFELSAVPEPGTWVLMALAQALGGLWWWKRRKSRPVPGL